MRRCFIISLLIFLPILASAQTSNFQTQMQQSRDINRQMAAQNQKWASERDRAERQWSMDAMMRHSMNKTATAEKKITSEEKNKQKLEEKVTKLNSDLKKHQDQLKILEDLNSNPNDDAKKDIEKTKEQILRSEEKLNKTKGELETSAKKLDDLKKEKEISLAKKVDLEKKEKEEKERKQKQDEINKALLKNLKSN